MAGDLKVNKVQLGDNPTANNNITLQIPNTPNGTVTLRQGTLNSVGPEVATLSPSASVFTGRVGGSNLGTEGALANRNKIIGGDFTTNPWQRGTTFAAVANAVYTADRFRIDYTTSAVATVLKTADAPTAAQAGVFTQHCLHVDITTADASIAAGDNFTVGQLVEGLNAASFGFGQAGTRFVTLSFWHKHTKTGTYCVGVRNNVATRAYVAEYVQDVSDTWEKATITIPVDTAGTWLYDTGIGLNLVWVLAAGTTFQTTANTWVGGNFFATANQVNALDSTTNNFKIALVQLEAGQTATEFETLDFGRVLQQCRRYTRPIGSAPVAIGQAYSTTAAIISLPGEPMRATPTLSTTSGYQITNSTLSLISTTVIGVDKITPNGDVQLGINVASGLTAGAATFLQVAPANSVLSAEL